MLIIPNKKLETYRNYKFSFVLKATPSGAESVLRHLKAMLNKTDWAYKHVKKNKLEK